MGPQLLQGTLIIIRGPCNSWGPIDIREIFGNLEIFRNLEFFLNFGKFSRYGRLFHIFLFLIVQTTFMPNFMFLGQFFNILLRKT